METYLILSSQTMKTLFIIARQFLSFKVPHTTKLSWYINSCLNVNTISDEDEEPEPRTGFSTLNFFADEIDWENIKEKMRQIKWKETLSEDPNEILETINALCFEVAKDNIPTRTLIEGKRRSKNERYRRSLTKRRRKITKKLLKTNSQTRKDKIKEELLQIEKKLQKSFKDSKTFAENKAIDSIKKKFQILLCICKEEIQNQN